MHINFTQKCLECNVYSPICIAYPYVYPSHITFCKVSRKSSFCLGKANPSLSLFTECQRGERARCGAADHGTTRGSRERNIGRRRRPRGRRRGARGDHRRADDERGKSHEGRTSGRGKISDRGGRRRRGALLPHLPRADIAQRRQILTTRVRVQVWIHAQVVRVGLRRGEEDETGHLRGLPGRYEWTRQHSRASG